MFADLTSWQHPVIVMNNISVTVIKLLVEFVYRGSVQMREDCIEKFLEAGKYLQIDGVAGDTRQVHLSDHNVSTFSNLEEESDREILNSTRTSDHVEALRDADHLRSFVLDVSNISHGFNRSSMKDVTVDVRRLSKEDAQRHYASMGNMDLDVTHGGSRRSTRLTTSQINYCEDDNIIHLGSINRSINTSRKSSNDRNDLVILDEVNISSTPLNRTKEASSYLSKSRQRSLLSQSVSSSASSTLLEKRARSERRQNCDYCHESIADAEIDNHIQTFHRRKSRQSFSGTPAKSKSFTNLGSLYRTKPMESKKSMMSKSSSGLTRTELFPRKSTNNKNTNHVQKPSNSGQQSSDRITMMRTLESSPAPINNSPTPSVPVSDEPCNERLSFTDDNPGSLLSNVDDGVSFLQSYGGDVTKTTQSTENLESNDGVNIDNEQMDSSASVEEAVAPEASVYVAPTTVNETKLIVSDLPTSSDYSSNLAVLGGRTMCKMCGMQVSDDPKYHFMNKHSDLF